MTVLACARPGCGGMIVDGYCDVDGFAPDHETSAVPVIGIAGATCCAQPRCDGTIEDGYCDACGLAPGPGSFFSSPVPESVISGTASTASTTPGVSRSTPTSTGRGRLGAGLVEMPPVQPGDPATAVLADPEVKESQRFCGRCAEPVGRGAADTPGRTEGFCKNCGTGFDFRPRLQAGDLVAGQYEVAGCLAHGGLGWIYLAKDRNVSDRRVVLKGLLNSGDADALAAAVAERRFLAEVEHPNIVRIYNFVQHTDSLTGDPTGYIVMEFVGGKSLKQIRHEHRAAGQVVPVEHALAYALEILPAFGYLHRLGLVYCDFKVDNVIQAEEQLKLIDLGGVCRLADLTDESPIYGTVGYQAPEIATAGPSPSSDLYTVGRALAVLTFEFTGYTSTFQHRLPDPGTVPVLAQHESFYRLLQRATHADPRHRFTAAAHMSEQLTGVLREVLAARDGTPRPAFSARFTAELRAIGATGTADATSGAPEPAEVVAGLPVPVANSADPAAGYLVTLGTLGPAEQAEALQQAIAAPDASGGVGAEAFLALARARLALGDVTAARQALAQLTSRGRGDWRVAWHEGLAHLLAGSSRQALTAFDAVYDVLPGELAPKLALGFAAEASGDKVTGARYFGVVWATDRSYVSAAFGLARIRLATGDSAGAVSVLGQVPETSTHHQAAQIAAIRTRIAGNPAGLSLNDIADAGQRLERLRLDAWMRHSLEGEVLGAALGIVQAGSVNATERLLDCELTPRGLRFGMERSYRARARLASSRSDRISLVDLANDVRPRTLT